jgi:hypothetical protein
MNKKQEKALLNMPQTGFHFDEENHLYVYNGRPMTGVTTILSVISKPALIQWSADEAVKHLGWFNEKYQDKEKGMADLAMHHKGISGLSVDQFYQMLCDARIQHAKRKTSAGTIGTDVHAEIERLVKNSITTNHGKITNTNENEMVNNFCKWAMENNIIFLESEKRLYSKEHWYAGTCDLVFLKDGKKGKKFVGDIKTSSGIYGREFFFQMAGYQIALEENGEKDFFGSTIIRCGKDGSFEVKDSFDLESDKAGFIAALKLYRELEK